MDPLGGFYVCFWDPAAPSVFGHRISGSGRPLGALYRRPAKSWHRTKSEIPMKNSHLGASFFGSCHLLSMALKGTKRTPPHWGLPQKVSPILRHILWSTISHEHFPETRCSFVLHMFLLSPDTFFVQVAKWWLDPTLNIALATFRRVVGVPKVVSLYLSQCFSTA